jgi:hypothetical protein
VVVSCGFVWVSARAVASARGDPEKDVVDDNPEVVEVHSASFGGMKEKVVNGTVG